MSGIQSRLKQIVSSYGTLCDRIDDSIVNIEDETFEKIFRHPPPMYCAEFRKYVIYPAVTINLLLQGIGVYYLIDKIGK